MSSVFIDHGLVKCPLCKMPMNGSPESHLPDCQLRSLQDNHDAALAMAVREQCAAWLESRNRPALMNPDTLRHLAENIRTLPPPDAYLYIERVRAGVANREREQCAAKMDCGHFALNGMDLKTLTYSEALCVVCKEIRSIREEETERCAKLCEFHGSIGMANAIREKLP